MVPRQRLEVINKTIYPGRPGWKAGSDAQAGSFRVVLVITDALKKILFLNKNNVQGLEQAQKIWGTSFKDWKGPIRLDITAFCTSVAWRSGGDDKWITASIDLDNHGGRFSFLPRGTRIEISRRQELYAEKGAFIPMLTVFLTHKSYQSEGTVESMSIEASDKMRWVAEAESAKPYRFKLDKSHKKGWTLQQILKYLAKDKGFQLGKIETRPVPLQKTISIQGKLGDALPTLLKRYQAVAKDKNTYVFDMRDGKLNLRKTTLQPTSNIYFFPEQSMIEGIEVSEEEPEHFYTQLIVKPSSALGTIKNRRGKKVPIPKSWFPMTVNPTDKDVQAAFGIIPTYDFRISRRNTFKTKAAIKKAAQEHLDETFVKPKRTYSFTSRGVLGLWPGSFVYLFSRKIGIKGVFQVVAVEYTLSEGQLLMSLEIKPNEKQKLSFQQVAKLRAQDIQRY